jgi:hypothetical protein
MPWFAEANRSGRFNNVLPWKCKRGLRAGLEAQDPGLVKPRTRRYLRVPAHCVPTTGKSMKKILTAAVLSLMAASAASAQQMNADDLKWVNQCINDNKGEAGGTPAVIRAYCTCMNEKMDNNETRSITQWEKANPKARQACEKQAGWK